MAEALALTPDHTFEGRTPFDAYFTPDALAQAIVGWLLRDGFLVDGGDVLEPSAGRGAFVRAVLAGAPKSLVTAIDIDPARVVELEREFDGNARVLVRQGDFGNGLLLRDHRFELVAGNPPFGVAEDHVRRALALRCQIVTLEVADVEPGLREDREKRDTIPVPTVPPGPWCTEEMP